MQDDYNRFIKRSIRQAQCQYEDIFDMSDSTGEEADCQRTRAANGDGGGDCMQTDATVCAAASEEAAACAGEAMKRPSDALPVMVFIQPQCYGRVYNEAEALRRGTLFPSLDKPFYGKGGNC